MPHFEDDESAYDDWYDNRVPDVPPFNDVFVPFLPAKTNVDFRGRPLQVIVKAANIHLTPEKPEYPGGAWHVEGMKNESIVATGLYYYYDTENVTESELDFRIGVSEPEYEQGDDRGVLGVYGLVNEGPLTQRLDAVQTVEGRPLCFPIRRLP
ncbi:MAG: uncharacterized protein KVP18_004443 [Porospora cf. gigantea A]|uniref:uncharacterized protein n=1 Tax=Porospora cf. gigantea A TaxID=2853593 RepID=UPI0035596A4F|nr:MAG: hypothetical protein KVP18_004443 [Porospora cf. gigantea A]